jgi:hypothetical protein
LSPDTVVIGRGFQSQLFVFLYFALNLTAMGRAVVLFCTL